MGRIVEEYLHENRRYIDEKRLIDKIEILSPEKKTVFCRFVESFEAVKKLSEGNKIPKKDIERLIEGANKRKDYYRQLLLMYKQEVDEETGKSCIDLLTHF